MQEIQQKKLFDIQCLWRAEKITIKEIKLTYDFHTWAQKIFSCPFIEPVSEAELDIYIQYLQSENFQHEKDFFCSWQDHRRIKDAYNNDNAMDNFPEWYDFHNGRTGLSIYLQFPDIRGEKEEYYLNLWRTEHHKNVKTEQKIMKEIAAEFPLTQIGYKPHISYYQKGWLSWFVDTFEDEQTQEVFERYGGEFNFEDYDNTLDDDLDELANADRIVPMQGWFDWREAVHKAADKYRREKIIEAMPSAYQQYRFRVEANLGFEKDENYVDLNEWYYNAILRGRELNGEKRDFDF